MKPETRRRQTRNQKPETRKKTLLLSGVCFLICLLLVSGFWFLVSGFLVCLLLVSGFHDGFHGVAMIDRIIRWCATNGGIVIVIVAVLVAIGVWSIQHIAIDALPDLSDTQ